MSDVKAKVLVVDDQKDIVETVSFCLKQEGYQVFTAGDGEEALGVARAQKPDVLILDVMLPKENGYQVARFLHEDHIGGKLAKQPQILMLTARVVEDPERQAFIESWTGTNHFMYKPFDLDELVRKVSELSEVALQP